MPTKIFTLPHLPDFQKKALRWAEQFPNFQYLNGNGLPYLYDAFPQVLAVSKQEGRALSSQLSLSELITEKSWWFGYLGYGYGHPEYNTQLLDFKEGEFFRPDTLLRFHCLHNTLEIESDREPEEIFKEIESIDRAEEVYLKRVDIVPQHSREEYVHKIGELKAHLRRGNVYQTNFCTRFDAENVEIDPVGIYEKLNLLSPMPFSSLLKLGEKFILCASPERYLKKLGSKVISQPIKGTAPRGKTVAEDLDNIRYLESSPKERAENVMIVDLVRNDLSQTCIAGSVKVEKLCEVRSFQTLHQLISTVSGELSENTSQETIIKSTFPMGSMTGAPKIRAMELIQELEGEPRGAFSGALGYFSPNGDFDLNVLIRSIFYNKGSKQLSFSVGSGITVLSDPEAEYEECLLKASAITQVLGN